jgi:hypothetical protein
MYSNLVKAGGIEIFAEILLMNGYLEYQEDFRNYEIKDDTIDYKTGLKYIDYKKKYNSNNFKPATFILITGSSEDADDIPEVKQKIIREVYNNINNIDGKFIKICLGSKVMNEGITLENVKEIHILDVHYNLGKVDQIIGRGIRFCSHADLPKKDQFVDIYLYLATRPNEEQYKTSKNILTRMSVDRYINYLAISKQKLIEEFEDLLKKSAIDCLLNKEINGIKCDN